MGTSSPPFPAGDDGKLGSCSQSWGWGEQQELVFNGDRVSVRDDGKFLELVAVMTAEKCECAS